MVVTERTAPVDPARGSRARLTVRLPMVLVAGVAVWALVLLLTGGPSASPVFATVPLRPAPVSSADGLCRGTDGLGDPTPGRDRVWVDANPSGATALWLPGLNDRPCVSVTTRLDAAHARALAAAVRSAQPPSPGISNCAADQGASVTVFFTYPGRAKAEVIRLHLGGCGGFSAPRRDLRVLPESGYLALRPAPPPWSAYFRS